MDKPEIKPQSSAKFVPAKIAQRCPICNGFGTLKWGSKTCQGCYGRGFILVPAAVTAEKGKEGRE